MRIGLISINRVGVHDPVTNELASTAPGVSDRIAALQSLPSLALLTIAGCLPEHHKISYLEVSHGEDEIPLDFDLVGISSYSAGIRHAYRLADRLRARGIKVVLGGPHVSYLPQEALEHCDAVSIGEAECTWPAIVRDCERGDMQKTYGELFAEFPLDTPVMPRFDLTDPTIHKRLPVQTSRGCPHRCEFCASSPLLTKRHRQKPIANVLAEIDLARALRRRPFIEFVDDNALVNRRYWKELMTELIPRKIRWFAETDISIAEDADLLDLMQTSGCAQVLIGLESANPDELRHIELNNNWKEKQLKKHRQAIQRIQAHGIRVIGCFIVGLDGQSAAIFDQLEEHVRELELFDVQVTVQTPFPGTPLYFRLQSEGRILQPEAWHLCTLFDINFTPLDMTLEDLDAGFKTLTAKLFRTETYEQRQRAFKRIRNTNEDFQHDSQEETIAKDPCSGAHLAGIKRRTA